MATTAQHSVHRPSPASTLARTPPSSAAANDDQVSSSENVQQQMQNSHEVAVPINHHLSQDTDSIHADDEQEHNTTDADVNNGASSSTTLDSISDANHNPAIASSTVAILSPSSSDVAALTPSPQSNRHPDQNIAEINTEDATVTNTNVDDTNEAEADDDDSAKRSWLRLLPFEQVIEIVLALDAYAPQHVRAGVWPRDIRAAMRNIGNNTNTNTNTIAVVPPSSPIPKEPPTAPVDDENRALTGTDTDAPDAQGKSKQSNDDPSTLTPASILAPPTSTTPTTAPVLDPVLLPFQNPLQPPPSTLHPQGPVPPPPHAYPHAQGALPYPYTTHPPYAPYPGYPGTGPYPPPYPPPAPPPHVHGHPQSSPFTSAPLIRPPGGYNGGKSPSGHKDSNPSAAGGGASPVPAAMPGHVHASASSGIPGDVDLPSYEDMLVQALEEFADPAGMPPKVLFQWMAAHYPLQQNFRPSASQALQKAYKRGRLEKSKDGRYRLNSAWGGGATSKRTTRRPQTLARAATNPHPSSHPALMAYPSYWVLPGSALPPNANPHLPAHASSASSLHQQTPTDAKAASSSTAGAFPTTSSNPAYTHDAMESDTARETWEAAQSILQALNLGTFLPHSVVPLDDATESSAGIGDAAMSASGSAHDVTAEGDMVLPASKPPAPPSATASSSSASAFPPPIFAGDISFGFSPSSAPTPAPDAPPTTAMTSNVPGSSKGASTSMPTSLPASALLFASGGTDVETMTASMLGSNDSRHVVPPIPLFLSPATSTLVGDLNVEMSAPSTRAALQGSLALLAAQLADIAGASSGSSIGIGMSSGSANVSV